MRRLVTSSILLLILWRVVEAQLPLNAESQKQMVMTNLSSTPLAFTENRGQWNEKARFKAEAGAATFWFCKDEVAYHFTRNTDELIDDGMSNGPDMPKGMPDKFNHPQYKKESMVLYAKFIGANENAEIIGADRLGYNCNYFYGNDPSKWATDVPNYSAITYKDIYQGIDLKYHGDGQGMKYDFVVNPGSDISQIKIKYDGATNLSVTSNGELEAVTSFGLVHENIPEIYQEINGNKEKINGRYVIRGEGSYGFEVDDYNPNYPLTIDPELVYSTYLGGSRDDYAHGIAVDGECETFITGETYSSDFPTQNPFQQTKHEGYDVFVAKLSSSGNSLIYSTYLGGNDAEEGLAIAVNGEGDAYITGETFSSDYPTQNPFQGTKHDSSDVFVTKLSPSGNSLIYSTFIGGNGWDAGRGIAVDGGDNAYIAGYTYSSDFPTQNPFQEMLHGEIDAFIAKLSPSGNSLIYSSYLGGNDIDLGWDIAIEGEGDAYITGYTHSSDFPTQNPFQGTNHGSYDAFVVRLSPSGNSLIYSTYLGGNGDDVSLGIAVDGEGNAYIMGYTFSSDFPTQYPFQGTNHGGDDAFVAKLSSSGNSLIYSTYLGGSGNDAGLDIAVDRGGAYITGYTWSTDFPIQNPFQEILQGYVDAFVARFSSSGNSLIYSTYLSGNDGADGWGIAVDEEGDTYVTGETYSSDFPTQNPFQGILHGECDVYIAKFGPESIPACDYIPGDINSNGSVNGVDIVFAVNYLKGGAHPPVDCGGICPETSPFYAAGDVNGNCAFNGIDITYFVRYLKLQVPNLLYCSDCPPATE